MGTYVGYRGILQEFPRVIKLECLVSRVDVLKVGQGRILDGVVKVRQETSVLVFGDGFLRIGARDGLGAQVKRVEGGEGLGNGGRHRIDCYVYPNMQQRVGRDPTIYLRRISQ